MSKRNSLILAILASLLLCLSNSSNPPNGKTGAPGEGACNECHTGSNASLDGQISISGLPSDVDPNTTYPITITLTNPNGVASRGGFQWVAINGSNGNAGSMANPSSMSSIMNSGGRSYHEHSGNNFFGSPLSWTVDWTAPSGPAGDVVTLYTRGVIGNGSGSANDRVVSSNISATLNSVPTPPTVTLINSADPNCNGEASGTAEVSVTGGTTPYMYLWSNGSTSNPAIDLPAGNNTVTVTDSGGLSSSASVVLNDPPLLSINQIAIIDQICLNASNGFIEVEAIGGTPGYDYLWSNGATTHWIANLSAGDYQVTVFDDANCTATETYTITETGLDVDILGPTEVCEGADITLTASGNFNLYTWSTGSIGPTTTVSSAGNVTLLVTDNNGCTGNSIVQINTLTAPNPIIQGPAEICPGIVNTLTVPGSYSSYIWSTGENTQSIDILDCGNYSATVSDFNGCQGVTTMQVDCSQPFNVILIESNDLSCTGDMDGSLEVGASIPTTNLSIIWSTGSTSTTIENLAADTYTVTMTDNTGCSVSESFVIAEKDSIGITIDSLVLPVCHDDTTSLLIVSGTGGTASYSYFWPNDIAGDTITQLGSGTYQATIVDANSCVDSVVVEIPAIDSLEVRVSEIMHVDCYGSATGSILLNAVGGHGSQYEYFWEDGLINPLNTNLSAGFYAVYVIDSLGCGVADTFEILQNSLINLDLNITNESQAGLNDGSVTVLPSGGSGTYSFTWSTGDNTDQITDLSPGLYSIIVEDDLGCAVDTSFVVNSGDCNLTITGQESNVSCANGNDGSVILSIDNGVTPYSFEFSANISNENIDGLSLINLASDSYTITIEDGAGCIASAEFSITQPLEPSLTIDAINISCNGAEDGSLVFNYENLTQPITYQINGILNGSLDNLPEGEYMITLIDANSCTIDGIGIIEEPTELSIELIDVIDASCPSSIDGRIEVLGNGGTGEYMYTWDIEATSPSITVGAGSYTVTLTDANMCSTSLVVEVEIDDITPPVLVLQPVTIFIGLDGLIELPAIEDYVESSVDNCSMTSLWFVNEVAVDCISQSYEVIIQAIDESGNISIDTTELTVTDIVAPQLDCSQDLIVAECETVIYEVSALDNCAVPQINLVSGIASGEDFPVGVTTIIYEAIDNSNNRTECSFTVEVLPTLVISDILDIVVCSGDLATVSINVEGGSGDYMILVDGFEVWTELSPGEHSVEVIDSNGCMDSLSFIITESPELILSVDNSQDESIQGANDGSISLSVEGGIAPYDIDWLFEGILLEDNSLMIEGLEPGNYMAVITDANGCIATLDEITIGIGMTSSTDEELLTQGFTISPNPAEALISIELHEASNEGNFYITNIEGVLLHKSTSDAKQIDISTLTSGVYFITFQNQSGSTTKKLVKL